MPSQMRSQTPTTQPATGVTGDRSTTQTGGAQAAIGNQALQAAMAEKSATPGKLRWERHWAAALRSPVRQLAQDEPKAAESAVGSAMKALGDLIGKRRRVGAGSGRCSGCGLDAEIKRIAGTAATG